MAESRPAISIGDYKVIFRDEEGLHVEPLENCYGIALGSYVIVHSPDYSPEQLTPEALRGIVFSDQEA